MEVSAEIKKTASILMAMASDIEECGPVSEGWIDPTGFFLNPTPLTALEASQLNERAASKAENYYDIANRLLAGEVVEGYMPGDKYKEYSGCKTKK